MLSGGPSPDSPRKAPASPPVQPAPSGFLTVALFIGLLTHAYGPLSTPQIFAEAEARGCLGQNVEDLFAEELSLAPPINRP